MAASSFRDRCIRPCLVSTRVGLDITQGVWTLEKNATPENKSQRCVSRQMHGAVQYLLKAKLRTQSVIELEEVAIAFLH